MKIIAAPSLPPPRPRSLLRRTLPWAAGVLVIFVIAAVTEIEIHWPFRYRNVEPLLNHTLASQVHIDHYHRVYFPHPGFIAEGITLIRNQAPDIPPVGSADRLFVHGRWIDLLLLRNRIQFIDIDNLHIVIPPVGSRANHEDFPPGSSQDFAGPSTLLDHLILHNATLDLMRDDGSRYTFPIHFLHIDDLQRGQTVTYTVDMDSPVPTGHILAHGTFGPLLPRRLADTPLSGNFTFAPVHLESIHNLHGTLSADGSFHGTIGDIQASARSSTTDFSVAHGRPTPIITDTAQFSIDGLNADIHVHSLTAHTGDTVIQTSGTIVGSPKVTNFDITVTRGRVQDLLHPFLQHPSPVAGAIQLHAHAYVAPPAPNVPFLQRLVMTGTLDIPAERLTNPATEQKLAAFSQRAQSHPQTEDQSHDKSQSDAATKEKRPETVTNSPNSPKYGPYTVTNSKNSIQKGLVKVTNNPAPEEDASADTLSGLSGPVTLRNAIASSNHLVFEVPGASVNLAGTFNLHTQQVYLLGNLHTQSQLSHLTTGFKSWLLIPLDPFFKKKGSGTVIPIAITGTSGNYQINQNLFHPKGAP